MKCLIINADDFGLNHDVNEGITRAWESGAATNATLMIKGEGAKEAVDFALNHPGFPLGLHLDLDSVICGDAKGAERFEKNHLSERFSDPSFFGRIEEEIEEQIRMFKEAGLELTHIDGHHHFHALPEVFPLIAEKMAEHRIKTVRFSKSYDLLKYPPIEWEEVFFKEMKRSLKEKGIITADYFAGTLIPSDIQNLQEGVTELMVHPGIKEGWRQMELDLIMSEMWREEMKSKDIKLISFKDL